MWSHIDTADHMSIVRTVAKNTGVLSFAQVFTTVLRLIFIIYVARSLGDMEFGKLGFSQSFTGLFVIFADIGLSTVTIREISRQEGLAPEYLGNVLTIKVALSLGTSALIALAINMLHYPADTVSVVYVIGLTAILSSFSDYMRALFRAFEKMQFEAILNTSRSLVTTGIGAMVLYLGYGILAVAFVYLFSATMDLLAAYWVIRRRFILTKLGFDVKFCKSIVSLAFPFSLTALVGLVYTQIDVVMLSLMKGDAPVGWYRAATVLVFTLMSIPDIFSLAIFPLMSRLYISSRDDLETTIGKSSKYLVMMGLPMATGVFLLSDRIIMLLFGRDFIHSSMVLKTISAYLPLRCMNNVTANTLSSINRESLHAFSLTMAAVANVVLNLLLIPRFGVNGAAAATALTEVALFSLYYYFVAEHFCRIRLRPIFLKPCLSCLAMAGLILLLKDINMAVLILSGGVVYVATLYLIGGFDADDLAMLKSLREARV